MGHKIIDMEGKMQYNEHALWKENVFSGHRGTTPLRNGRGLKLPTSWRFDMSPELHPYGMVGV